MNDEQNIIEQAEQVIAAINATQPTPKVLPYNTIEEYSKVTGKRFRMTKEQKARGISRSEAFEEFKASK